MAQRPAKFPEFGLTSVTTSPFEASRRARSFEEDEALQRVRRHLQANFHRRVSLAEAAEVAGFERTYFSAYFSKRVGIPYVRWMNALRIARAIDFMRKEAHGRGPQIRDIAARVGYADLRTFERNFRRLTGLTPTDFLRQCRRRRAIAESVAEDTAHPSNSDQTTG